MSKINFLFVTFQRNWLKQPMNTRAKVPNCTSLCAISSIFQNGDYGKAVSDFLSGSATKTAPSGGAYTNTDYDPYRHNSAPHSQQVDKLCQIADQVCFRLHLL